MMVSGESTTPSNMMYLRFMPGRSLTNQHMQTLIASAALHPGERRKVLCQNIKLCHSMQDVVDVMYAGRALVVKTAGCPQLDPH